MDWRESIYAMMDIVLPRTCIVCGSRLSVRERHLCSDCAGDIPLTYNWNMATNEMADKFNALIQRDLENDTPFKYEPYAYATALFFYRSGSNYREITRQLKYHGNMKLGRWAARKLGTQMAGSPLYRDVDIIVPVPLHWARQWRRGYNQAAVIAGELASAMGAACQPRLLERNRHTKTQTHVSVKDKAKNVAGAFTVNSKIYGTCKDAKHILIVDDVFTTGSTLNECRKNLRALYGPEVRISVATLGYVGQ